MLGRVPGGSVPARWASASSWPRLVSIVEGKAGHRGSDSKYMRGQLYG